jgi:hypothetical protein
MTVHSYSFTSDNMAGYIHEEIVKEALEIGRKYFGLCDCELESLDIRIARDVTEFNGEGSSLTTIFLDWDDENYLDKEELPVTAPVTDDITCAGAGLVPVFTVGDLLNAFLR